MNKDRISIVICTFNGARTIRGCLDSVIKQDFSEDMEILVVDGGSSDNTCDIVRKHEPLYPKHRFQIIENPNRLPEGFGNGKWLGYLQATGDVIAFIDQDNILQRPDVFSSAAKKLSARPVLGVLGGVTHDPTDPPVVRYAALFGTDSFFAYRSLDNLRTDRLKRIYNEPGYKEYEISKENMLLTGGNCFFYRKRDLDDIGGYGQDVSVVKKLLAKYSSVGVITCATKHYAEKNMAGLIAKKFKWGQTYCTKEQERFDYLPNTPWEFVCFARNLLFNILIIPNFYYSIRIFVSKKDLVSFLYPPISFLNTVAYGYSMIQAISKRFLTRK